MTSASSPSPRTHKRTAIYRAALDLSGAAARDCVYVDDKIELLAPAADLGMSVVHFQSPAQLTAELERLGFS